MRASIVVIAYHVAFVAPRRVASRRVAQYSRARVGVGA
jgi:hypothetical protein